MPNRNSIRYTRAPLISAALVLCTLIAACGGDGGTTAPSVADLTTEQRALIYVAYSTTTFAEVYASTAQLSDVNQTHTGKDSVACTGGGYLRISYTATASGTATSQQNTGTTDFVYSKCMQVVDSRQYTLDGKITTGASTNVSAGDVTTGWTINGTLSADNQSCAFENVVFTLTSLTGKACGVDVKSLVTNFQ